MTKPAKKNPLREIFDFLDIAKSGVLSRADFIKGLRYAGVVVDEEAIMSMTTKKFDFTLFSEIADPALKTQRSENWQTQLESCFRALSKPTEKHISVDEFEKLVTSLGPHPVPRSEDLHALIASTRSGASAITYPDLKKLIYLR